MPRPSAGLWAISLRNSNAEVVPTRRLEIKMESETDEELLQRVAARNEAAFAMLYDRFSGPLYGLVKGILWDGQDASDALQDGFLYLWDHAPDFDPNRGKAFTWATVIFRNKAIDRLRASRRRDQLAQRAANEVFSFDGDSPLRADVAADTADRVKLLKGALAALSKEQRRCIESAFLKGMTHHQLAESMNTPLGTIKTNIRRGLLRLRGYLRGEEQP